jgi:O-succinylbenzoic acid--CoA ligase
MQDWLKIGYLNNPHAPALAIGDEQWIYHDLYQRVNTIAANLFSVGVGDRVAVLLPNNLDYACLAHAVLWRRGILVPLNTRLTETELAWQIGQISPRLLIFSPETEAKIRGLDVPKILASDLTRPSDGLEDKPLDPQATCCIMFTSGTSGQPKGVMLTYNNFLWSALGSALRIGTLPDDRWLCCLPLYHIGGLSILYRCALYGTSVYLEDGFDVESIQRAFDKHAISLISLVPTMLYRLIEAKVCFPASLRLILLGGAAASPELLEQCIALNLPIAPTYGLTEACSQVATLPPDKAYQKPASVGRALPFSSIAVLNEAGLPCQPGEYGQVIVKGSAMMQGYYNNPTATAEVLHDGSLYTGDIGYLDEEGDLHIVQRRSDLILSGGENVYPAEVEQVLRQHPAVRDACVVGIPSAEWGQQVAAAVVLKPAMTTNEVDLTAFCRAQLAGYKIPRRFRFVEFLPKTASGKIERKAVIDLVS